MSGRIAVVTDSTAYLPVGLSGLAGVADVRVVPLSVVLGGVAGEEGTEVAPDDVVRALRDRQRQVTTSRPTPAQFRDAYLRALEAGARGVVSVHLSRLLSGTFDSARAAAAEVGGDAVVRVVDSRSAAMGLGFSVLAAAGAAHEGAGLGTVSEVAMRAAERTSTVFYVDTLEHLRRGGRIGAAQALLGTALSVKPILHISDGLIVPLDKVRTAHRAIARLASLATDLAGTDPVDVAVQHLGAPERAHALAEVLRAGVPGLRRLLVGELGAVVGAHVGPGVIGVVVARL